MVCHDHRLSFPTITSASSPSPMEDCPNEPKSLHALSRKRKADPVDLDDPAADRPPPPDGGHPDALRLDPSATPRIPTDAPEVHAAPAAWLLVPHHHRIWHQPASSSTTRSSSPAACAVAGASSPQPSFASVDRQEGPSRPKRPRVEIPSMPPSPRKVRRARVLYSGVPFSPRRFARHTRAAVVADNDVVSAVETRKSSPEPTPKRVSQSLPVSPIEATPPAQSYTHVPPHSPPINRETLKELDLEAILRNPQLRHDLLFDPGLQFRPTFSPRKRNIAESYWVAIVRELENGCTCTTLDANGKPIERRCVCSSIPMPVDKPIRAYTASGSFSTVRMPSRLKPLLTELLEVLVSIIQPVVEPRPSAPVPATSTPPPTTPSAPLTALHPVLLHPHYQQNASHVSYLRSILDIDLIQQEIGHGLFDPSGVFQAIGDIIRCYCAPMRDHAVDQMVGLAKSCGPGGTGTKNDAVRAIRMCFEIMELMKLDVANHQLQTLRPYLVHSAAQFELKMFQEKTAPAAPSSSKPGPSTQPQAPLTLSGTRQWLQTAWEELALQPLIQPKSILNTFLKSARTVQMQMAATRAIVNLVFDPPTPLPSISSTASTPANSPPSSPRPLPSTSSHSSKGYPETLYLDHLRLTTLRNDAADYTALYMLLMLYRQLVHTGASAKTNKAPVITTDDMLALKKEMWEIGPSRLGLCFVKGSSGRDEQHWRDGISDVVLQLVVRASSAQRASSSSAGSQDRSLPARSPDGNMLKLATSWTDSNLRANSPLSGLMKKRIKRVVEEMVLSKLLAPATPPTAPTTVSPSPQPAVPAPVALVPSPPPAATSTTVPQRKASPPPADIAVGLGLEPLLPEIRHLADRLGKLVGIHLNVYGALYAQPGFLKASSTNTLSRTLALTSISDSEPSAR
ncbi:Tcp11-domain-containing protein [Trametopsis cervina]|nr:Tcp11-domain-containing protein [Trametopsis cervina]